jgi:hypothetical protein
MAIAVASGIGLTVRYGTYPRRVSADLIQINTGFTARLTAPGEGGRFAGATVPFGVKRERGAIPRLPSQL